MDKTIEKEFFKAFELGGVVHMCFDWMQQKYDLWPKFFKEDEGKPRQAMPEEWQQYYDIKLPQKINELTAVFDNSVIDSADSPLMNEIANNIDSLTGRNRDVYIFSLLTPFKEFSDKVHPLAVVKQLNGEVSGICGIKDFERDLKMWENLPANEPLKDINGKSCGTPKEQADACRRSIRDYKYRIEQVNDVANQYLERLGSSKYNEWLQEGTVEYCMSNFFDTIYRFANRLDALLLERGINLLWYQQECGVYLKEHRHIFDVEYLIGSRELAIKYISEAQPKLDKHPTPSQNIEATQAPAQQAAHFNTTMTYQQAQSMLVALQQNGFIDTSTTAGTFYYRMTGKGTPSNEQIKWVKLGKRRKRDISKSSLVYFLSKCANYNVDNTQQCRQEITDVFGFELSASTINSVAECEYSTEINTMIGSILQS